MGTIKKDDWLQAEKYWDTCEHNDDIICPVCIKDMQYSRKFKGLQPIPGHLMPEDRD